MVEQSKSLSATGSRNAPKLDVALNFLARKPSRKSRAELNEIRKLIKDKNFRINNKNEKKYNSKNTDKTKIIGPEITLKYVKSITRFLILFLSLEFPWLFFY